MESRSAANAAVLVAGTGANRVLHLTAGEAVQAAGNGVVYVLEAGQTGGVRRSARDVRVTTIGRP